MPLSGAWRKLWLWSQPTLIDVGIQVFDHPELCIAPILVAIEVCDPLPVVMISPSSSEAMRRTEGFWLSICNHKYIRWSWLCYVLTDLLQCFISPFLDSEFLTSLHFTSLHFSRQLYTILLPFWTSIARYQSMGKSSFGNLSQLKSLDDYQWMTIVYEIKLCLFSSSNQSKTVQVKSIRYNTINCQTYHIIII